MPRLKLSHLVAVLGLAAAAWLAVLPPAVLPAASAPGAALGLATVVLLATGVVPEHVTALLFFVTAMLFAVAPAGVVFAGFQTTAFWMVFGGLVIGVGVRRTGLAERLAEGIGRRLAGSYGAAVGGCVLLGLLLSFLMPSTMGRILILMPIVLAMADALGYPQGSNGRTGMVLAVSFASMLPAFTILPATVPAMVLVGAGEGLYGISPVYGSWLLLHFPVLGLPKALLIWVLVLRLFPDGPPRGRIAPAARGPMRRDERTMALLLVLALLLWITDFAHHVSPAWVALAVAAVCVLPAVGLVPPLAFNERINYASLFYIACVLGLGALVAHSGAGDLLARAALDVLDLQPGQTARTFAAVVGLSALIAMVLPYQAPPLVVAMQLGHVAMGQGNKLCLALLAITVPVLLPLDFLWWRLLGWFG